MKNPELWTKEDLHHHLQSALELEFWTIPLYLTALYSIKDLDKLEQRSYPDAAKLIASVVAQEMLHLELVCNISNAFGFAPKFKTPVYNESKGIPFFHTTMHDLPEILKGYFVKPQALNKDSLKLFCTIEIPFPESEINWEHERSYNSIADVYAEIGRASCRER